MDLDGAIDLHVHTAPDLDERSVDDRELVRQASAAGMRAVLLKNHYTLTADRAALAAEEPGGLLVFGGLALNDAVGGLNPVVVETAIAFGAREIWMPTVDAAARGRPGISIFDAGGAMRAELWPILEMVRDHGLILGTGHIAPAETVALLRAALDLGLTRLLVTHPMISFLAYSHGQMRELAELGAVFELVYLSCSPGGEQAIDPEATAAAIRAVGAGACVLASDGGPPWAPPPPEMLRAFGRALGERGVSEEDLRRMTRDQPARLLGI